MSTLTLIMTAMLCDVSRLEKINISSSDVLIAGCSHAADFAHQFHIAFSDIVTGACIFSGQPFHCAVTRFAADEEVTQTPESSVPHCEGCDTGETLIYDHCKNHPQWVDVGKLPDYIRRSCGQNPIKINNCIDDPINLLERARVFLFHPTHDRCYLSGAVANVQALYYQLLSNPGRDVKFINDQPFPHTLPTNSTPFFNHSVPSGYDGPGKCLRWNFGNYSAGFQYATTPIYDNVLVFDQTEFIKKYNLNGTGVNTEGVAYIPNNCKKGSSVKCRVLLLPNGCSDGNATFSGSDWDFIKYAESNHIVVLKPCVGGAVNIQRYPNSYEIQRGLLDVYGQLSSNYSYQSAPHMRLVGSVLKRIMFGE